MAPLSGMIAKPLLPFWNQPILGRIIHMLHDWGVNDILINCHHRADSIVNFITGTNFPDTHINISFEPRILGTAGALRRAEWFLGTDPLWIVNGDIAAALDPAPILGSFLAHRPLATLWLTSHSGPRTVEMRSGRIRTLFSHRPGRPGTYTFCGLQLVDPVLLKKYLPENEHFAGLAGLYEAALHKGESLTGCDPDDAFWADLGSPEAYLAAHRSCAAGTVHPPAGQDPSIAARRAARRLRRNGVQVSGFAAVDGDAQISPGASLQDSVVIGKVTLGPHAVLHDAIAAGNMRIVRETSGLTLPAENALDEYERTRLRELGLSLESAAVEFLPARGSGRSFLRIHGPVSTEILIRYDPARRENLLYADCARFLAGAGVPVPEVHLHDRRRRRIFLQDLGRRSLLAAVRKIEGNRPTIARLYRTVLDATHSFHSAAQDSAHPPPKLMPPFGPRTWSYERNLFLQRYVKAYAHLDRRTVLPLEKELRRLARHFAGARHVLIHRDLQADNVFIVKGKPVFIDFQGMRPGPPSYDLAALLCDPYVMLPERLQGNLLERYCRRSAYGLQISNFFWQAAVLRLIQTLGAFARFSARPATARFEKYIPAALTMLQRCLSRVGNLPHLRRFVERELSRRPFRPASSTS